MRYAYYPGCSQEGTAREYDQSARAVCRALDVELVELPDWNCCGASSAHATDYWLSHALAGRNLAIAEKEGLDIVTTCPACFLRLKDTRQAFRSETRVTRELPSLVDMPYQAGYDVRHLLDVIGNSLDPEMVRERVTRPLGGLRLVAYYGCYLVRPPEMTGFDDAENPQTMDRLLGSLEAKMLDWSGKVSCCGGSLSLARKELITGLVAGIGEAAREVGAEAVVTACPLCQANLETRQEERQPLPVFYFTELLGLALGCDAGPWFRRHLISPSGLLKRRGLLD